MALTTRALALFLLCFAVEVLASQAGDAGPVVYWRSKDSSMAVIDGLYADNNFKDLHRIKQTIERDSTYHFSVDSDVDQSVDDERSVLKSGFRTNYVAQRVWKSSTIAKLTAFVTNTSNGFDFTHGAATAGVTRLEGRLIESSDFNPAVSACHSRGPDLLAIIILSKKWRKNDYGEVTIYTSDGEIETAFYPKYGRVVLLPCGSMFKLNPPSIGEELRHYFLFVEFSSDPAVKIDYGVKTEPLESSLFVQQQLNVNLSQYASFDPSKYLVKRYFSPIGEKIYVFDNALPSSIIDTLKDYFWRHAQYTEVEIELDSEDNVRWLLSLEEKHFTSGPIWFFLKRMVDHVSERTTFHPYDIACNNIRQTDNTIIHQDCSAEEEEYTILTYLNPNVTEQHYGETAFYTGKDVFAAVRPTYGRTVIFNGNIPHSARPFSAVIPGARYSYAVKTSKDEATAAAKMHRLSADED